MRAPCVWMRDASAAILLVSFGGTAAGCGAGSEEPRTVVAPARVGLAPVEPYRADFALYWRHHLVGEAREELTRRPAGSGYRFTRWERWRVARGGTPVEWEIDLAAYTDHDLRGEQVAVYRDRRLQGSAFRSRAGWLIESAGEGEEPRRLPGEVELAELVRLRLARHGQARWTGRVLLAGFDFAVADLAVEQERGVQRAVLSGPAGQQETRMWLRKDGTLERAEGPDLSEKRGAELLAASAAPDLVELGAIPVDGPADAGPAGAVAVELELDRERERSIGGGASSTAPVDSRVRPTATAWPLDGTAPERAAWAPLSIPDPVPGPALRELADRIAAAAGDGPLDQLRALARASASALDDDLSRGPVTAAGEALSAGRADCVGHAALFSGLARARGFDVRLVTGYRLENRQLTRHMWALVRVDGALVPIDPTFGEAPISPGRHLGLTTHGSAPGEIALAAELAFAGLSGARARFVTR